MEAPSLFGEPQYTGQLHCVAAAATDPTRTAVTDQASQQRKSVSAVQGLVGWNGGCGNSYNLTVRRLGWLDSVQARAVTVVTMR